MYSEMGLSQMIATEPTLYFLALCNPCLAWAPMLHSWHHLMGAAHNASCTVQGIMSRSS